MVDTGGNPVTFHNVFETVEGLVAVGTIGLAVVTAVLARQTRNSVRAARDEVKNVRRQAELRRHK
jgi:hypothetical protein